MYCFYYFCCSSQYWSFKQTKETRGINPKSLKNNWQFEAYYSMKSLIEHPSTFQIKREKTQIDSKEEQRLYVVIQGEINQLQDC